MADRKPGDVIDLHPPGARPIEDLSERYRIISTLTSDYAYAFRVDEDGLLESEWVTGGLERLTGWTAAQLTEVGGWEHLILPEDVVVARQQLETLLAGKPCTVEYRIRRRDGAVRWMRDHAQPEMSGGRITHIYGAVQDIEERRQAQTAFEESEQKYRMLVDLMPDAVVVLQDAVYRYASPAFRRMFGYSELDVAHGLSFFDLVQEHDRGVVRERFEARIAGTASGNTFRLDLVATDGRIVPCETSATLIQFDGRPADLVIIRDVSERSRLERQLRQAQKMEALGTLAGGIAHDMNNILGMIMGLSSLLESQCEANDPRRRDIEQILAATRRGSGLTGDLLRFARKSTTTKNRLDLTETVGTVVDLLRRTIPKDIVVETRLQEDLAPVDADGDQLVQALMNACLNSVQALENGGTLTIEARNADASEPAPSDLGPCDHVRLIVADTGCGMSQEAVELAFDPFFTTKQVGQGTGLGLAMVYATMRNHQGAVTLESTPGRGTTLTMFLPASEPLAAPRPHEPARAKPSSRSGTVLLADDEEVIRQVATRMLERLGYRVLTAANGQAALELFRAHRDELVIVLLDIAMPVMGGVDCLRQLRALDPAMPVLVCSGTVMTDTADEALAAGATGVLTKPFDIERLDHAVRDAIGTED